MTTTDTVIPYYVWFTFGSNVISIVISTLNFGMILVTLITVRGIQVPLWMIPAVAAMYALACIATGYFFEKYKIWDRITSHQNVNANPQMRDLIADVAEIKGMMKSQCPTLISQREDEILEQTQRPPFVASAAANACNDNEKHSQVNNKGG